MVYQDTQYDATGRAYRKSNPYRNDGQPVYWTQVMNYDLLNRPLIVRTPDDGVVGYVETSHGYNGRIATITDPKARLAESTTNSQGWVVSNTRNKNAGSGALDYSAVTYSHDALGNVTGTVASGVTTSILYDVRGRKTEMTEPNMGTWRYRYNAFGELIWQKNGKSQIVTLSYDALGRMTSRVEPEGTTTWTYDSASHAGAPAGAPSTWVGLLGSVTAPGGYSESHSYDLYGRPSSATRSIDGSAYTLSQTYDALSRPEKTIYPTNFQVRNVYNTFGFVKEVRRADSGKNDVYWQADHYSVDGKVDGEIYGNGLVGDRVYSAATGRLLYAAIDRGTAIGDPSQPHSTPYSVQDLFYSYDGVGNVLSRNDGPNARNESFTYDGLDRLRTASVNGGSTVTVNYDQKGNITAKTGVGNYTYGSSRPHAVTQAGGTAYIYDDNGNMTNRGSGTLLWTSFNQLLNITQGGFHSTFSFGAGRERVKHVNHLGTTVYIGAVFERVTNGGAVENKHYIMTPTGRTAVRVERSDASIETRYFHSDGLGSIVAISDERGAIQKRFAYDPWGKRVDPSNGATITGASSGKFYRGFTDHEHLDDLGLIHMNGRVYDPTLGRFLSADPFVGDVGDSQEYNRYSYVGNNPMNATDPSGYFSLKDGLKIVAAVVVGVITAGAALYGYAALMGGSFVGGFAGALSSVGLAAGWGGGWAIAAGAGFGFGSSFAGSLLNGGSIGDAFKAGVIGGIVGGVSAGVAGKIGDFAEANGWFAGTGQNLTHGALQGGLTAENLDTASMLALAVRRWADRSAISHLADARGKPSPPL